MKISYKWLKEYIDIDLPPEKVSEILTDTGLEVEGAEEIESIKGGLKGVVIGKVLTCEAHPNADRLRKTTVDIGGEKVLDIVCGAPNVAAGQKVLVATVGTTLYTDEGSFQIKKSKIRGEVSQGMICAEDELNLGTSHDGIMVLDEDAVVGTPAAEYFKIESDHVIEIGLTPNRTDAMCHYGVARDLRAALLRHGYEGVEANLPSVVSFAVHSKDKPVDIAIENTEACPRYAGVSLKNVKVGPSPEWMQNRLKAIGVGPINNVVDITNYVLHETGHPMHAFDSSKIKGGKIVVKTLPQDSPFVTLDGKERKLDEKDLMICDAEGNGLCIAGVLGGEDSGVSETTTDVFLECAYFHPVWVRKTAKRQGLNTDASFRYERGVDPDMTLYALKRAATLIRDLAGGEIAMEIKDHYPKPIQAAEVGVNLDRINQLIGQSIEAADVRNILNSLDIKILSESGRELLLSVPPYRTDVRREADVVEEILRIYGFNSIEAGNKMSISVAQTDPLGERQYREKISTALSARAFNEIMNNSLTKPTYYDRKGYKMEDSIEILNPLSNDLAVMRQSLLFGGLEAIAHNTNRQRADLSFYEFGQAYRRTEDSYGESLHLGLWKTGSSQNESWQGERDKTNFYHLKAEVEFILERMGFASWDEKEGSHDSFDFAMELLVNNKVVGTLGKVNSALCKEMDIKQDVFYADLNWDYLCKKAKKLKIKFQELPKYPEVRRDLALLIDKAVNYNDLKSTAQKTERKLLRHVNLFDVYEGKNLPAGKKSYALSFTLRDDEKTLNDKQVDKVMDKLLHNFKQQFGAELR